MDNRSIVDFELPNELIEAISDYLGNDDVHRLAATCRFFHSSLNDYKVKRLQKRKTINDNITANKCIIVNYLGTEGEVPKRIIPYKQLVIGVTWHKLWAWDRSSGELKWESILPDNCSGLFKTNISIIENKIVCMIDNNSTYVGATVPYILIFDTESGLLLNQYIDTKKDYEAILENLTAVTDQHIIIKRINGLITCYDTDFNVIESYQSTEVISADDYQIILATPRFIVDIDFCLITIINRSLGTVATLLPTHDPSAAYIYKDKLIVGFSNAEQQPLIPFQLIDLETAAVVFEYKERWFGSGWDNAKTSIRSIAMRDQAVFLIAYGDLYYVNMRNNKSVILDKLPDKIKDYSIEIFDNYLFVTLAPKKYVCSMWDIESMEKLLSKRKVYEKPSWNQGRLFITNNLNYVCADFNDKKPEKSLMLTKNN